jgi:hypothetical protein
MANTRAKILELLSSPAPDHSSVNLVSPRGKTVTISDGNARFVCRYCLWYTMKHRTEVSVSDALNVSYTHSSFHQNQCVNHCKHRANYSNWLDNELEGTGSGVDVVTVPGVKDSVQEVIVQDKEEEDEEEEDKEEEEEEEGEEKKYGNQSYLEGDDDKKLPAKMPAFTKKTPKTMDKFKKGKGYVNQHADKQPSVLPIGKTGNDNNDGAPRLVRNPYRPSHGHESGHE